MKVLSKKFNPHIYISEKVKEIKNMVGDDLAVTALSGGVDSSVVTMLGHKALGNQLKAYFINNGLMREGEPEQVVAVFKKLGVKVEVVDARSKFFSALAGISDPEEKREAITQTFYKEVFQKLVKTHQAKYLLQGTILTDIEETAAGIKRQHNVFAQIGIDPQKAFGYRMLEPLIDLRKDGVRRVAKALGLPVAVYQRMPFPGPALSARVIGSVTAEKIDLIRKVTLIVENQLRKSGAFQYMAILHNDRVTGMREGKRAFGLQVEIRCWDSLDARKAYPTRLPFSVLTKLADKIVARVPEIVSVTYNIASKPPSTMEAV